MHFHFSDRDNATWIYEVCFSEILCYVLIQTKGNGLFTFIMYNIQHACLTDQKIHLLC